MIELIGRQRSFFARLHLAAALLVATAYAQTLAPPVSQSLATAPPVFDVSTVKRNTSDSGGSHPGFRNGTFTAVTVRLKNLMQYQAFGIPEPRIVGGPKWLD